MSERVKGRVGARVGASPYKTHVLQYLSPPTTSSVAPLPLALSLGRKTLIPGLLLSEVCL